LPLEYVQDTDFLGGYPVDNGISHENKVADRVIIKIDRLATGIRIIGKIFDPILEIVPEQAGSAEVISGDEGKYRLQLLLELLLVNDSHARIALDDVIPECIMIGIIGPCFRYVDSFTHHIPG
jgi:hypothetical protein